MKHATKANHRQLAVYSVMVLAAAFCLVSGCDTSDSRHLVPVSGVVSWQGEPLTRGRVLFIPGGSAQASGELAPRFATGTIDSEGGFRMTSFRLHDGVVPGAYSVVIDDDLPPSAETGRPKPEDVGPLPKKYASEQTSELVITVEDTSESRVISFALPSEE